MTPETCLRIVQTALKNGGYYSGIVDGLWGPLTEAAIGKLRDALKATSGLLSSFADPRDVDAFDACKAQGKSDQECFKVGDNGIGCWGDNTAQDQVAMCALPPEDMVARWGSVGMAKHKPVIVRANGLECVCVLADRMPSKANIHNGAVCDLNPAAAKRLNLTPPFMVRGSWTWG